MLELYHGSSSVCSAKVRVGLVEKGLNWKSHSIALPKGEQFSEAYLAINPNGVLPTLIHDGFKVFESSLILEYIDALSSQNVLMPQDPKQQMNAKLWLLRCIDIHSAINTMTFSSVGRANILANKTADEIAASIAKMPNPKARAKRADLMENGIHSNHVASDFYVLKNMFQDMNALLEKHKWLGGATYSITDAAIIAYVDRLERLGMSGLWQTHFPNVGEWLKASQQRPSYEEAINAYTPELAAKQMREKGADFWPELEKSWHDFLKMPA
ncbi:MAG: glutathione S-transferase family protein [Nitratireductor sp.]